MAPGPAGPDGRWGIADALAWLESHVNLEALAGGAPGTPTTPPSLDRMRRLVALLGEPQRAYPVVHVTGTNGKGSTARIASTILGAHGLSVGLYTSPDLGRVHQRIARDGEPIDDVAFAEVLGRLATVEAVMGERLTRFEILTAAAFLWFADVAVDAAVIEVGMAGRWDATNVADGRVAVVTNVSLDHTDYLGPTTEGIAKEKAGIIKPGSTVVLGETDPALAAIFRAEPAAAVWERDVAFGCTANRVAVGGRLVDLYTPGARYSDVLLPLHGAHQADNAAAAVAACEAFLGRPIDPEVLAAALAAVRVPARFEVLGRQPLVVVDGAHNPAGAAAAARTLDEDFAATAGRVLVVGMNRGRDPLEMLQGLAADRARLVVATQPDWVRALPAEEVATAARALGVAVEVVPAVPAAVQRGVAAAAPDEVVLVTGSLYVVSEARLALGAD